MKITSYIHIMWLRITSETKSLYLQVSIIPSLTACRSTLPVRRDLLCCLRTSALQSKLIFFIMKLCTFAIIGLWSDIITGDITTSNMSMFTPDYKGPMGWYGSGHTGLLSHSTQGVMWLSRSATIVSMLNRYPSLLGGLVAHQKSELD